MKNKKGFTLVEMISVIILLSIIFMIMIPGITKLLKNNNSKMNDAAKEAIEDSALDYIDEHNDEFYTDSSYTYCITINDLIDNGNITEEMISSLEDKSQIVNVTFDDKKNPQAELKTSCTEKIDNVNFVLVGNKNITIEVGTGSGYIDQGAIAKNNAGQTVAYTTTIINSKKETVTSVNTTKLDKYTIKYKAVIDGETYTLDRAVKIVDTTAPIITGDDIEIFTSVHDFDISDGITITDNSGEIIKPKVTSNIILGLIGTYKATYKVVDSSGNTSTYERKINVVKGRSTMIAYTLNN